MAFTNLNYTKDWSVEDKNSALYFPTHESNESQVRSDMQLLYNDIKTWANSLIVALGDCSNIGMGEVSTLAADNVKDALIELKAAIVAGTIPDYSLTSTKMSRKSVEGIPAIVRDNIANDAISGNEIADDAVDSEHIASGAIEHEHMAEYEEVNASSAPVGTKNIQTGAVTSSKLAAYSIGHNKLTTVSNPDGAAIDTTNIVYKSVTRDRLSGHFNATASVTSSAGKIILVPDTFLSKVNNTVGTYTFTYNGTAWALSGNTVALAQYGISTSGTFVSADTIIVTVVATTPAVGTDQIENSSVTNDKLAGDIPLSKLVDGYIIPIANGGTGQTTPAGVRTAISAQEQHTAVAVNIAVADWNGGLSCTKSVTGITASNTVLVTSDPSTLDGWMDNGVKMSAQGVGTATFTAESTPDVALVANILILN